MAPRLIKPTQPITSARPAALPSRDSGWAVLPADRSFKVLQPSRTPAQLSLFPSPGQVQHLARNGR